MPDVLLLLVALFGPFGDLYLSDGTGARAPVLPAFALPRTGGGWLPPPPPPSVAYILGTAAAAGRQPGDFVVSRKLEFQELHAARQFPTVGKGRLWVLNYRCDVFGPDGPYTIYVARDAIVRVP